MDLADPTPAACDGLGARGSGASAASPQSSITAAGASGPRTKRRRNAGNPDDCCRTCRLRKVKCSGNKGSGPCANCSRLDLACAFVQSADSDQSQVEKISRTTPSRDLTEAGTLRKRAQRACSQCHLHKTKCSGDLPRCRRCQSGDLVCEYIAAKRKFSNVTLQFADGPGRQDVGGPILIKEESTVSASTPELETPVASDSLDPVQPSALVAENVLANRHVLLKHIDAYFHFYFPIPCYGFLHPPTIYRAFEEGSLSSVVAAGICSFTSRIVSPGQATGMMSQWSDQVDFHIFRNMDSFLRADARENLVVLGLATLYNWVNGHWNKVWMYLAMAARVITALQLNWDAAGPFIKQEGTRRLVWMVWMMDRLLSGGFDDHLVLRDEMMYLRFPCSNDSFRDGKPSLSEPISQKPSSAKKAQELSMYGCHIRLHRIRHHILGVTKRFVAPPTQHPRRPRVEPSQVMDSVTSLQSQLSRFSESLPDHLKFSELNTQRMFGSAERSPYVMLHVWHWQLHVDLYRFAVPGLREEANSGLLSRLPHEFIRKSQKQAVAYAVSLARFWQMLQRLVADKSPGVDRLFTADHNLAVIVIQSTKILLAARQHHLYSDLGEHSTAPLCRNESIDDGTLAALIESNLEVLAPLASFLPRVKEITHDLRATVENFHYDSEYDKPHTIGMPAVKPPDNVRLPGPHYILENAFTQADHDGVDDAERNASMAERWFRGGHASTGPPQPDKLNIHELDLPELPFHLAQARGFSVEPQPSSTQEQSMHGFAESPIEQTHFHLGTPYDFMSQMTLSQQQAFDRRIDMSSQGVLGGPQHAQYTLDTPGSSYLGSFPMPYFDGNLGTQSLFRQVNYG